jgi:hypothetical protein
MPPTAIIVPSRPNPTDPRWNTLVERIGPFVERKQLAQLAGEDRRGWFMIR